MGRSGQDPVAAAYAAAHARWPKVRTSVSTFRARLNELHPGAADEALRLICLEDLFLVTALLDGDRAALAVFESEFLARVVPRLRRFTGDVDDLLQDLRSRLLVSAAPALPRIAKYTGKGPLSLWVRTAGVRLSISASQKLQRAAEREQLAWADDVAHGWADDNDPELDDLRQRYRSVLSEAYKSAALRLEPDQRALLYLSVGKRVGIDQLAKIHGVHRSTVARRITAAKTSLVALAQQEAAARINAGAETISSIERIVRSQVEFSVRALAD